MIKNLLSLLFLGLIITACNRKDSEALVYKDVYSINLNGLHKKNAQLSALIAFESQYEKTNFKLKDIDVDITIDGIDIGTYYSKDPLMLKAKSQIKIPLSYTFENSKIQDEEGSSSTSYIVVLKGNVTFIDDQGNEEKVSFSHKETVNTIAGFKERRKAKINTSVEKDLSRSEVRKLRKEKRRDLKLEESQ